MTIAGGIITAFLLLRVLIGNLLIFFAFPMLVLLIIKPVSRYKFGTGMFLLAAVKLGRGIPSALRSGAMLSRVPTLFGKAAVYIMVTDALAAPIIFGFLGYAAIKLTRYVDEKMPKEYRKIKPVYAEVTETDELTALRFSGRRYVLSKEFPFRIGSMIKVRIIEDREDCFLA